MTEGVRAAGSSSDTSEALVGVPSRSSAALARRSREPGWLARALAPFRWLWGWKARRDLRRAVQLIATPGMVEHAHVRDLMRLGDLCARGGEVAQARVAYTRAAQIFAAEGHAHKAIALIRQIAAAEPSDPVARVDLARALAHIGRRREAALEYQSAACLVERHRPLDALKLLGLALELDPTLTWARARADELESIYCPPAALPDPEEAFDDTYAEDDEGAWIADAPDGIATQDLDEELGESDSFDPREYGEDEDLDAFTEHLAVSVDDLEVSDEDVDLEIFAGAGERVDADERRAHALEDEGFDEVATEFARIREASPLPAELLEELDATREYGASHIDLLVSCAMDTSHASVLIERDEDRARARARADLERERTLSVRGRPEN